MAVNPDRPPLLPVSLPSWEEMNRRVTTILRYVYQWITNHVDSTAQPNPHDQYLLESDALQIFAFAAYGGLSRQTPGIGSDLGAGWQTIEFDSLRVSTPRGITVDVINNTIAFDFGGIYAFSFTLGWEHNSSNSGRLTNVRLYNETTASPVGAEIVIGTGRNAEATTYSVTTLLEITEAMKFDVFRLEIGGGDTYTSVDWDVSEWTVWNVGEWREPLPSDP